MTANRRTANRRSPPNGGGPGPEEGSAPPSRTFPGAPQKTRSDQNGGPLPAAGDGPSAAPASHPT
ncbi:hypothetical protein PV779_46335, partial [Streptomyces sp. ID01-9D]|nr:hypothetical protein [Streptomyces sp. ID01-9D]